MFHVLREHIIPLHYSFIFGCKVINLKISGCYAICDQGCDRLILNHFLSYIMALEEPFPVSEMRIF